MISQTFGELFLFLKDKLKSFYRLYIYTLLLFISNNAFNFKVLLNDHHQLENVNLNIE